MPLLRLNNVHLAYGDNPLLNGIDLQLDKGDRLCLLGRNGSGKSSLMRVLVGEQKADDGDIWLQPGAVIARLEQDLPAAENISVYDYIAEDHSVVGHSLAQFDILSHAADIDMVALEKHQKIIEDNDGWSLQQRIDLLLRRLQLPRDALLSSLSGGWRRRVSLARALSHNPDILLLDEPTNHLDVATIEWMEEHLLEYQGAIMFVTHDRRFLKKLANRIVELDRGNMLAWQGSYDDFLEYRERVQETEDRHNKLFDIKLAEEEKWIRQGIKARRTRNEGRVRALKAMRDERKQRVERKGNVAMTIDAADSSGKIVAELIGITKSFADKTVIRNLSTTILRGDKVGLIGPNGVGKSTLIKMILGQLQPDSGELKLGTKLEVAYFDQMRDQLDPESSVFDNVSNGRDFIEIGGKDRHVMSYLGDFLFPPARVRSPVKALSGGEKNRLLLAKMFSKQANLLVMDEPTNDLDVETLELLEEILGNFDGTLLLVTHDREFMDNVVTQTLAFEGDGVVREYIGGYQDWLRQRALPKAVEKPVKKVSPDPKPDLKSTSKVRKLTYKLQLELEQLPAKIESLEAKVAELEGVIGSAKFATLEHTQMTATLDALSDTQQSLDKAMERWMELEAMADNSGS
ncbi:MAG TPA: ATP-binding cassette domain-containing protein [Pseudomonadales bacterium]|nr:ATP-binding cassette domain-containing protein [Pseudomonadales bacterium]